MDDGSERQSVGSRRRRRLLASIGTVGASGLAGCFDDDGDETRTTTGAMTGTTTDRTTATDTATPDGNGEDGREAGKSHVTFHDIDDFGADPTGEEPSDEALDAAADAADPHDWIVLTNGEYLFEEYHRFSEPYTIEAAGSTLECTQYNGSKVDFSQSTLHDSFQSVFHFKGRRVGSTAIAAAADEGDDQLTVADPDIFEPGDDIVVGELTPGNRAYEPTRSVVRDVEGDTLHLHTPLKYDYEESSVSVASDVTKLDAVVRPRVRDAHFTGDAGCHVSFELTREALMENCVSDGYRQHAYQVIDGLDTIWRDCHANDPLNIHGSHGEPFRIVGSSDVHLVRPVVNGCRRGIDVRSGCKTLRVLDPQIRGATLHGICYHSSSDQPVAGNIYVKGGQISCRLTDDTRRDVPNEVQTGWAVSTSSRGEVRLEGVDIIGRRRAINMRERSSAGEFTSKLFVDNCSISMTGDDGTGAAARIRSGEVVLDDVRIENPGVSKARALDIEGQNVDVSARITGNFRDDVVTVRNARDVSLDLDVEGWSGGGASGVHVAGGSAPVDGLSITGSIEGPGRGVTLARSDVRNVTLRDLDLAVDTEPAVSIHRSGDASGVRNVRLLGCDTAGGEAGTIEVGSDQVDGLWVKNCAHGGLATADGPNEFVRDNVER